MFCAETCAADADCMIGAMDLGFTCGADNRCGTEAMPQCTADAECVALFNGWQLGDSDGDFVGDTACTVPTPGAGEMCAAGESCCVFGFTCLENGFCAQTEPAGGCTAPSVSVAETDVEAAAVMVCGQPGTDDATCAAMVCTNPCAADADCVVPSAPVCNTDTGMCGCGEDSHCADVPGLTMCNTATGQCNCTTDSCTGDNQDICNDNGFCGCSATSVCTVNTFDGTTASCEAI